MIKIEIVINNNEHTEVKPAKKNQFRLSKNEKACIFISTLKRDTEEFYYYTYIYDEEYKQEGTIFIVKNKNDMKELQSEFPLVITNPVLSFGVE